MNSKNKYKKYRVFTYKIEQHVDQKLQWVIYFVYLIYNKSRVFMHMLRVVVCCVKNGNTMVLITCNINYYKYCLIFSEKQTLW